MAVATVSHATFPNDDKCRNLNSSGNSNVWLEISMVITIAEAGGIRENVVVSHSRTTQLTTGTRDSLARISIQAQSMSHEARKCEQSFISLYVIACNVETAKLRVSVSPAQQRGALTKPPPWELTTVLNAIVFRSFYWPLYISSRKGLHSVETLREASFVHSLPWFIPIHWKSNACVTHFRFDAQ